MRRLIINADDFGLTPGVDRAITECHRAGTVTSTTLMANGSSFDDAVEQTRANPGLRVGCHIVLIDGTPITEPEKIQSLIGPDGRNYRMNMNDFARAAFMGDIEEDDVAAAATTQIKKIQNMNIEVTHVDSHKHTHMFPTVMRGILRAATECGVKAVRNPFVPLHITLAGSLFKRPVLWTRSIQVSMLHVFARGFHKAVRELGMKTTDGTFGITATGSLNADLFAEHIAAIPDGTWEMVCHPGYNDSDLDGVRTRLRGSRQDELDVLTSPETRKMLASHGVELITYADL